MDYFNSSFFYLLFACFIGLLILLITGSNKVSEAIKYILNLPVTSKKNPAAIISLLLVLTITIVPFAYLFNSDNSSSDKPYTAPVLSNKEQKALENAVTISFSGDLILMRDQILAAKNKDTGAYDFSDIFEYTKLYIDSADYAVGIFEGPCAGEEAGYTTGNFDDNIPLTLNYPDSFATDVKAAGYDLVTTANNHLLDKDFQGAMRTLDVLDQAELDHVGSYRSKQEKDNIFITNIKGIKVVFLAYTYGCNYYDNETISSDYKHLTSLLEAPGSSGFRKCKKSVAKDFENAKALNPDCIVVLPHMGTQFETKTDDYQDTWNKIFADLGADIILGDHAHAIQPIEYITTTSKDKKSTTLVINCPGNFVNGYTDNNGDGGAIVEIYIDIDTKKPFCAAVIPIYITQNSNGIYLPIPIFNIFSSTQRYSMTDYEKERVKDVHSLITKTMIGVELPIDQLQERYYYTQEGYKRIPINKLEDIPEDSLIGNALENADSVCFVGDSVTAGSNNGGFGWYEPLSEAYPNVSATSFSFGGATTKTILSALKSESFQGSDLYVIALGTNDIRYRDEAKCALTPVNFVETLAEITEQLKELSPEASFIFIAPWPSLDNDIYQILSIEEKHSLFDDYIKAEQEFCTENEYIFLNPMDLLYDAFAKEPYSKYLTDYIHPNSSEGIYLYSKIIASFTDTEDRADKNSENHIDEDTKENINYDTEKNIDDVN